jgi:hypothetical protein
MTENQNHSLPPLSWARPEASLLSEGQSIHRQGHWPAAQASGTLKHLTSGHQIPTDLTSSLKTLKLQRKAEGQVILS